MPREPQITMGRIFRVYFTSLRTAAVERESNSADVHTCAVIANTAHEAVELAETAFPGKVVDSIHSDDYSRGQCVSGAIVQQKHNGGRGGFDAA